MLGDEGMYGAVDTDCAQDVIESVGHRFPILGVYLDGINLPHGNVAEVASCLRISAQKSLTYYIWRRSLWSLGFIVAACCYALREEAWQQQEKLCEQFVVLFES